MSGKTWTVIDVIREAGCEPEKPLTWHIGEKVRAAYEAEFGELPTKALRTKTNGPGSHCFACYPAHWRARGETIVLAMLAAARAARRAQPSLPMEVADEVRD